jgi:hypothetical protein
MGIMMQNKEKKMQGMLKNSNNGAFTLGVKDSSVESPNTMLVSHLGQTPTYNGAFTLDVKWVLNENLGGILGGTEC